MPSPRPDGSAAAGPRDESSTGESAGSDAAAGALGPRGGGRGRHRLERYQERALEYYLRRCPTLYRVCFDRSDRSHRKARLAFRSSLGLVLGLALQVLVVSELGLGQRASLVLGALLSALLALGCALSLQIRCICLLTIPGLFGRAGRSVLKALVLGYIIAGPIFNLTFNSKEVMRSFACTTQLTYNLTKVKVDLMFRPFHQAMRNLNDSIGELNETIASVSELIEPLKKEIEDEDELQQLQKENDELDAIQGDTRRSAEIGARASKEMERAESDGDYYEAKYREKISARCEEQLSRGALKCRDSFKEAYDKCYNSVKWFAAWLLCWPMKLTFICNMVQTLGGSRICDPDGKIDVGVGEGYATLKETKELLEESLRSANVEYKLRPRPITIGLTNAAEAASGLMRDFEARKRLLDGLIGYLERGLALVFVKIVVDAARYRRAYLRDIEHDNVYVTPYFRRIDARRRLRGSATLLPLKKLERAKLVDPYGARQTRLERRSLLGQTAKLLMEVLTASVFVLVDRMLFEVLDVIRTHARLEITQVGHHDMAIEIRGTGLVAGLVRSLVRGFNVQRRVHNVVTNEACLPRAHRLPAAALLRIYGTYLAVWLMLLGQAYSQRLRRLLAGYFYRRREKRRVLHLYNETLRRRSGFLRHARRRALELARAHRLLPRPWLELRLRHPAALGWLARFACARRRCVVCEETEARRGPAHRLCPEPDCPLAYCGECWADVGRACPACDGADEDSGPEGAGARTGSEDEGSE